MPANDKLVSLALDLSRLIRRTMAVNQDDKSDMSMIRNHALCLIKEHTNITMSDFAALMKISPSTATAFTDRLVRSGMVERAGSPTNRKTVCLRLTKRGTAGLRSFRRHKEKLLTGIFSVLSVKDRNDFQRILSTILQEHDAS